MRTLTNVAARFRKPSVAGSIPAIGSTFTLHLISRFDIIVLTQPELTRRMATATMKNRSLNPAVRHSLQRVIVADELDGGLKVSRSVSAGFEVEVWTCGHTRKCKWKGVECCLKLRQVAPHEYESVCPSCGGNEFYIKKVQAEKMCGVCGMAIGLDDTSCESCGSTDFET